jgi:glutathione S-transferase
MPFDYISVEEAIARDGLRMVVVGNVPSPWGEAAKGILHIKQIPWAAVRLVYDDPALAKWAGELSGPVAVYNDEAPVSSWRGILQLAERLAQTPALLPDDAAHRDEVMALASDICDKNGLGWARRLQAIDAGMKGEGGFIKPVAEYLAPKYGYTAETGAAAKARVLELLGAFAARLKQQADKGSDYYVGDTLSVADVYSAAFMALFAPLPPAQCNMKDTTRAAFESMDEETRAALDTVLLAHRDRMYERHLELPLNL